jgi:hypothetical protein
MPTRRTPSSRCRCDRIPRDLSPDLSPPRTSLSLRVIWPGSPRDPAPLCSQLQSALSPVGRSSACGSRLKHGSSGATESDHTARVSLCDDFRLPLARSPEYWAAVKPRKPDVHVFFYLKANKLASGNFLPKTAAVINLAASMEKVMPLPP